MVEIGATFRYDSVMAETVDALVVARMDAKGWTREDIAARADISTSGLRKLCRGQVADARGPTVNRLAKVLGVSPKALRAAIEASRKAAP